MSDILLTAGAGAGALGTGGLLVVAGTLGVRAFALRRARNAGLELQESEFQEGKVATPDDTSLQQDPQPRWKSTPPSQSGQATVDKILASYERRLVAAAGRIAHEHGAEQASPSHVEAAATQLGILSQATTKWAEFLTFFGGLIFGAALGYYATLTTSSSPTKGQWNIAICGLLFGAVMLVAGWAIKLRK